MKRKATKGYIYIITDGKLVKYGATRTCDGIKERVRQFRLRNGKNFNYVTSIKCHDVFGVERCILYYFFSEYANFTQCEVMEYTIERSGFENIEGFIGHLIKYVAALSCCKTSKQRCSEETKFIRSCREKIYEMV